MNTQTLIDALRALNPEEMSWKFALYGTSKSRDGLTLEWNLCDMKAVASWVETLRTAFLAKPAAEKTVAEYSPFLSDKEFIAAIEKDSDVVRDQIRDIILNIQNGLSYAPEDFTTGVLPKVAGYGFYGERNDDEGKAIQNVLFMRRGNPFLSGQKIRLCTTDGKTVVQSEKPLLKFTAAVDFIFIGDVCYFNSSAIEKDFDLENRNFAIAAKRLALIADADIVSDYERLEETVMKAKNARKFTGFDKEILEHIVRIGVVAREEFLSTYGVTIDASGRMDTGDPEQCELIIDLLCCRSVLDPLGRLATGNNITPRE